MESFFNQMNIEDPRCIDVTILYKDIDYFAETGEIRFTPRDLSDYELDFIVNDLEKHCKIKLPQDFIQKYLSLRSTNKPDTEDTSEDNSDSDPRNDSTLFSEDEFTDEERDNDTDITD